VCCLAALGSNNILLPRNYKAWLQSSSAVEASLEHTKWTHQPYFEEEAPTYCCYFGQFCVRRHISKAKIRENSPKIHGYTERGINRAGLV
jgi:hypothetical protein